MNVIAICIWTLPCTRFTCVR